MLNTSALVLSTAPEGSCHPHFDVSPPGGVPPTQYRVTKALMSTQDWQTASVSISPNVQFPVAHSTGNLDRGSLFSDKSPS